MEVALIHRFNAIHPNLFGVKNWMYCEDIYDIVAFLTKISYQMDVNEYLILIKDDTGAVTVFNF